MSHWEYRVRLTNLAWGEGPGSGWRPVRHGAWANVRRHSDVQFRRRPRRSPVLLVAAAMRRRAGEKQQRGGGDS
jgi:hypothetical protein